MSLHVLKFGGTSLAAPDAVKRAADILSSNPDAAVAVVSAPGKRNPRDEKITDALYRLNRMARAGDAFEAGYQAIAERFLSIAQGLHLSGKIDREIRHCARRLTSSPAEAASVGEYLSARIFSEFTGREFLDARDVIAFSENGEFLPDETQKNIQTAVRPGRKYVIPGFYGGRPCGYATFSRGGSDETGSVVAVALHADLYENWTDVSGLYSGDPSLVDGARVVPEIGYDEMQLAAHLGACVLSPDSIPHAAAANIPIRIKNTFRPEDPGTLVSQKRACVPLVAGRQGLAIRAGQGFLSLTPSLHLAPAEEGEKRVCAIWRLPGPSHRLLLLPGIHIRAEKMGGQLIVAEEAGFQQLIRRVHGTL